MDNMNTSCFPLALAALKSAKSANERIERVCKLKWFTYTGNSASGTQTQNVINFPSKWNVILSITGTNRYSNETHTTFIDYPIYKGMSNPNSTFSIMDINNSSGSSSRKYGSVLSETDDTITLQSSSAFNVMNYEDLTYYVMYI